MEVPQAHFPHTVGACDDGQAHGMQSWAKIKEKVFVPCFLLIFSVFRIRRE